MGIRWTALSLTDQGLHGKAHRASPHHPAGLLGNRRLAVVIMCVVDTVVETAVEHGRDLRMDGSC